MTGRIIRSKNCKPALSATIFAAFAFVASLGSGAPEARAAATGPKLPVIQQVGVIPVQWEGAEQEMSGLDTARAAVDPAFGNAMRNSHRFHVLSDDLVAGLWQDKNGRDELIQNFELQSFASLGVAPRGDTVVMTARLLDPNLKTELLETDTVPRSWLVSSEAPAIKERIEQLAFRLVNRLPVDVAVTSVQGQFLTLSGGSEQGVQVGDQVELQRATISSLHPANGSWLEFTKQNLGTAQVIETKGFTSVARIIKLTFDNAVEAGDGAKIPAIAGRVKFARQAENDGFKDAGNQAPIIVPPLYLGTPPKVKTLPSTTMPTTSSDKNSMPDDAAKTPLYAQNDGAAPPTASDAKPDAPKADQPAEQAPTPQTANGDAGTNDGKSVWDSFGNSVGGVVQRPFDDAHIYAGPSWWSIKGTGWIPAKAPNPKKGDLSTAGKFPVWLINSFGGGITRSLITQNFHVGFGGGFGFGQTTKGRWTGYDANAMIYYEDHFAQEGELLNSWRAGGLGHFSGWGVTGESFGGGDYIRAGGFGGLGGRFSAGAGDQRYDWYLNYALFPLDVGRTGYAGQRQLVESSLGWQLNFGAYHNEPAGIIQWGGEFVMGTEKQTLHNGLRGEIGEYTLRALAKYVLP